MNRTLKIISIVAMTVSSLVPTIAQQRSASSTLNPQLTAAGSQNRIAKFVAPGVLGDSYITEDKFGNVGIGTTTPTSPLTVQGMIEITLGGLKFPDGTMQTTAPVVPSVFHNTTLTGNGTSANPLSVAVPLSLTGADTVFRIESTGASFSTSTAIRAKGGNSATTFGGDGVTGIGGDAAGTHFGGTGVSGRGGSGGPSSDGGRGLEGEGGPASGGGHVSGVGVIGFPGQASNGATIGLAGRFMGDVEVLGTLSKSGGSFKIDHPLDPENKYLSHSFVESPDMMNIYNGNITTDRNGMAVVELPDWFEALNREFRYQLTVVGQFAQAIVAEKVKGNRFTIQTNAPDVEVSWQVTGIRQDAWANRNRIKVEEQKAGTERGHYLHPEAFDQPDEKNVMMVWYPDRRREMKQRRLAAEQEQ